MKNVIWTLSKNTAALLLLMMSAAIVSCGDDNPATDQPGPDGEPPIEISEYSMGYNADSEKMDEMPRQISFGFTSSQEGAELPSSVDLRDHLPPIGDQGQYGTCVTWAIGYAMHTYLHGVRRGLTKEQLASPANQFSPADLWMSMGSDSKGTGCDGSSFEPALDVLQRRGITTLQNAPYSSIRCDEAPPQSWTNDAANYKILNYRTIYDTDLTVENLKSHLAQKQVVAFGARLGDNFMSWTGDGVISSDTYLQPGMQHAYHAMALVGYDDNKGPNGAFLVFNSWSTKWGNEGCIWVDYDFFIKSFVYGAFVATVDNNVEPNDDNEINPDDLTSGSDLASYHAFDMPLQNGGYGVNRQVYFNIYNTGTANITSTSRWSIVYMYYNAFNANDYGILAHLYFTDEIPAGQIVDNSQYYIEYVVNKDVPSGRNIAAAVFDQPDYEYLYMNYYLPPISGYYYMVVMADPFNCVQESNEQNNFFFITNEFGYPYYFQGGYPMGSPGTRSEGQRLEMVGKRMLEAGELPTHTPVNKDNRNAYTPDEIQNMLLKRKQSGELEKRIREFDKKQFESEIGGRTYNSRK